MGNLENLLNEVRLHRAKGMFSWRDCENLSKNFVVEGYACCLKGRSLYAAG